MNGFGLVICFIYVKRGKGYDLVGIENNMSSLHDVILKYSSMILRIAVQNTNDYYAAEDITQEVLIKFMNCDKEFDSENYVKAWLIKVTLNMCRNYTNSSWRQRTVPIQEKDITTFFKLPEDKYIFESIMRLSPKYKNVLYLYYYEGYTVPEIADLLEKKENTVSTWLRRARIELEKRIEEEK